MLRRKERLSMCYFYVLLFSDKWGVLQLKRKWNGVLQSLQLHGGGCSQPLTAKLCQKHVKMLNAYNCWRHVTSTRTIANQSRLTTDSLLRSALPVRAKSDLWRVRSRGALTSVYCSAFPLNGQFAGPVAARDDASPAGSHSFATGNRCNGAKKQLVQIGVVQLGSHDSLYDVIGTRPTVAVAGATLAGRYTRTSVSMELLRLRFRTVNDSQFMSISREQSVGVFAEPASGWPICKWRITCLYAYLPPTWQKKTSVLKLLWLLIVTSVSCHVTTRRLKNNYFVFWTITVKVFSPSSCC